MAKFYTSQFATFMDVCPYVKFELWLHLLSPRESPSLIDRQSSRCLTPPL